MIYTESRSGEETSLSVRKYATAEILRLDEELKHWQAMAKSRMDSHQVKSTQILGFVERVDADLSKFKNYTDNMKLDKIISLFKQASEDDLINDNV